MDLIAKLLAETIGRSDRGIVCLLGDPQWTKTSTVARWCQEYKHHLIVLLHQTEEPETIAGYDVKNPKTGRLQAEKPSWLREVEELGPETKVMIFHDELDKPREQNHSAILSLLCDRRIKRWTLGPNVSQCCAMNQPRSPLSPALVERLLFVQYPPSVEYLRSTIIPRMGRFKSVATDWLTEIPKMAFPVKKKNPGAGFRIDSWMMVPEFWTDQNFRETIIMGLVPEKDIPWMLTKLDPKSFMGIDAVELMREARPADITSSLIDLLKAETDQQKRYDILKVLCERANEDKTGEIARVLAEQAPRMQEIQ